MLHASEIEQVRVGDVVDVGGDVQGITLEQMLANPSRHEGTRLAVAGTVEEPTPDGFWLSVATPDHAYSRIRVVVAKCDGSNCRTGFFVTIDGIFQSDAGSAYLMATRVSRDHAQERATLHQP
jgi:hypothetical protein